MIQFSDLRTSLSPCSLRQPLRGSTLRFAPYGVTSVVRDDFLMASAPKECHVLSLQKKSKKAAFSTLFCQANILRYRRELAEKTGYTELADEVSF